MKVSNEKKSFENIFPIILHSILSRTSSALFSMYFGTDKAGFIQTSFYQIFGMITVGRSKQSAISKKILTHSVIRRVGRIRTKGMDYFIYHFFFIERGEYFRFIIDTSNKNDNRNNNNNYRTKDPFQFKY